MHEQLGVLLRNWRRQRGLPIHALAARAGIAQGTLSGWERGLHQPRLVELEAVLAALAAMPAEGTDSLLQIQPPRAGRLLALFSPGAAERTAEPVPGELLRGLRARSGLTLEAVARDLGIHRSTVGRWENSE